MKNYLIISLLFLSLGFSQKEYNSFHLTKMDNGLWTEIFYDEFGNNILKEESDVPLTGKVYGHYGIVGNRTKVYMGNLLNGKREGSWEFYFYKNGQKVSEETYKDGKLDGLFTTWIENGLKVSESTYKDGKKHGLYTLWFQNNGEGYSFEKGNGQKSVEMTYKNGKEDGLTTFWYENGQKKDEFTFKDGIFDGLYTEWYENGQKKDEGTWKNGKVISSKEWNEDGSVKE